MIGVHFTEVEEFLDELDRHADEEGIVIERAIVRATPTYRLAVGVRHVGILASFISSRQHSLPELVRVEAQVGSHWGNQDADAAVNERRDALMDAIRAVCDRHGLEMRAGWYEGVRR